MERQKRGKREKETKKRNKTFEASLYFREINSLTNVNYRRIDWGVTFQLYSSWISSHVVLCQYEKSMRKRAQICEKIYACNLVACNSLKNSMHPRYTCLLRQVFSRISHESSYCWLNLGKHIPLLLTSLAALYPL